MEVGDKIHSIVADIILSAQSMVGSSASVIAEKLTADHISKIIINIEKQNRRKYILSILFLSFLFFTALTLIVLLIDKELYPRILEILGVFLGGSGTGIGLKGWLDKKK